MTQNDFGEVRALVQQDPTSQTWEILTQWLYDHTLNSPEWVKVEVLPYVSDHLNRRWPAELRRLPLSWYHAHMSDSARIESLMALCTTVDCLTWGKVQAEHLERLCEVDAMDVQHLDLKWNFLGNDGLHPIWTSWPNLTHLNLAQNRIDDVAVEHLTQAPYFASLKSLELWGNPLTDNALYRIVDHAGETLENLSIWKTGKLGCKALVSSDKFTRLKHLDLSWTTPAPQTLSQFMDHDKFPSLMRMSLVGVKRSAAIDRVLEQLVEHGIEVKT